MNKPITKTSITIRINSNILVQLKKMAEKMGNVSQADIIEEALIKTYGFSKMKKEG